MFLEIPYLSCVPISQDWPRFQTFSDCLVLRDSGLQCQHSHNRYVGTRITIYRLPSPSSHWDTTSYTHLFHTCQVFIVSRLVLAGIIHHTGLGGRMEALSLPYMPFSSLICTVHYLCFPRFTAIAWPQRKGKGATFFSQQIEPFGVSARGLLQPKFGQQNEDGTSMDARRYYDSRELFLVSPGVPRKDRKHYTMPLLMPPGKKTKKTLACVFAGANVLGMQKRDNRPILIYR